MNKKKSYMGNAFVFTANFVGVFVSNLHPKTVVRNVLSKKLE